MTGTAPATPGTRPVVAPHTASNRGTGIWALLATLLLCLGLAANALADGATRQVLPMADGPVTITAEKMSFANQTGEITFIGDVLVVRADMTLSAGRLVVTLAPGDGQEKRGIHKMIARDNVRFAQGTRTATAGHAEYDPTAETIVLTDKPQVTDPSLQVVGTRITINLATQESIVDGGALTFTDPPR